VKISNLTILHSLQELHAKVDILMSQQDDINALATELETDVAAEDTALSAIEAEIASLQAANPALDLTALRAAVAGQDAAVAAEQAVVPPAV
jgi:hypothetical protein